MQKKAGLALVCAVLVGAVGCSKSDGAYALEEARLDTMEIGIEPVYSVRMHAINPGPDTFLVLTASVRQGNQVFRDSTGFYALQGDTVHTEVVFPEARLSGGLPTFEAAIVPRNRR